MSTQISNLPEAHQLCSSIIEEHQDKIVKVRRDWKKYLSLGIDPDQALWDAVKAAETQRSI